MRHLWIAASTLITTAVLSGAMLPADGGIAYPADYRTWTHVKSSLVGPTHSSFASNGGYHHFYANAKALEGYKTGQFPDGSILVDDGLEAVDKGGVAVEGTRRRVAIMVKDSRRFAASGNWGFELFPGDTRAGSLDQAGRTACFTCHQKAPRDLVFSAYRQ